MLGGLHLERARRMGDPADFEAAESAARRSLENLPGNPAALLLLARCAEARHRFGESIDLTTRALDERPGDPAALLVRATAKLATGDVRGAENDADDALSRIPGSTAYATRALALAAQGRDEEAMRDFASSVAVEEPDDRSVSTWVRTMAARTELRRGRASEARGWIHAALGISPGDAAAISLEGEIELRAGRHGRAAAHFREAFGIRAEPVFLIHRGIAESRDGRRAEAESTWSEAEVILREEVATLPSGHRLELAKLLLARGRAADRGEALRLAEAELAERRDADTLATVAEARLVSGDASGARGAIREALSIGARRVDHWELASRVEEAAGNSARARFYRSLAARAS